MKRVRGGSSGMKKLFLYLFMGVGLLYTYALAHIFSKHRGEEPGDDPMRSELDNF